MPEVEEIPIVEGTEEAHLCTVVFVVGILSLVGGVLQIEVAEQHVEA